MSAATNPLGSTSFHDQVLGCPEPVVVDFTAAWCAPCRRLSPVLAELAERYRGRVRVVTVDVEAHPGVAQVYRVTAMPTLLVFRGGQVVEQQVGFSGRAQIEALFSELAGRAPVSAAAPR